MENEPRKLSLMRLLNLQLLEKDLRESEWNGHLVWFLFLHRGEVLRRAAG